MKTAHLVSHTHWDREWYQTQQVFRLRLVHLVDNLLALLEQQPEYRYFMLDGQTIILDDYLEMRPARRELMTRYILEGRLLIGPWYVLPDEFLVSPEALIRNLCEGARSATQYGGGMPIGYIPDTFGHIGQLPQIFRGFGMQFAALRRGLSDEPAEIWWAAPDGSQVLTAYLRDGYDNAVNLPCDDHDQFTSDIQRLCRNLAPHCSTSQLLLMHGSDHVEPHPATAPAIESANATMDDFALIHSTLPDYLAAVHKDIEDRGILIPTINGELRSPKRHHLLPGVLSSRTWIKQRNSHLETLLERWVEPYSGIASVLNPLRLPTRANRLEDPAPILRQAWRYLLQNHPHDSICGCSIDKVHEEMRVRFDHVEQIGDHLLGQALDLFTANIDTTCSSGVLGSLVVFNPHQTPFAGAVDAYIPHFNDAPNLGLVDDSGVSLAYMLADESESDPISIQIAYMELERDALMGMVSALRAGPVAGFVLQDARFHRQGPATLFIEAIMVAGSIPSPANISRIDAQFEPYLSDPRLHKFIIQGSTPSFQHIQMVVPEIPSHGWRTFHLQLRENFQNNPFTESTSDTIENEYFKVSANRQNGTITVYDKLNGKEYAGMNYFTDGGDAGDLYNYSPPANDLLIDSRNCNRYVFHSKRNLISQELTMQMVLDIPAGLTADRCGRSQETQTLTIDTTARLSPGQKWVAITTVVHNPARDHRLRVHFPLPFSVDRAYYDGHFEVVERPAMPPDFDQSWVEHPTFEQPQRHFCAASDGELGLMVANQGMPEAALLTGEGQQQIVLTLLRCTGWLSRIDLATRQGSAGREIQVPGAQEIGRQEFHYALIPHSERWETAFHLARAFQTNPRVVFTECHEGKLPSKGSFLSVEPQGFVITAIKPPNDGQGLILRGFESGGERSEVRIKLNVPFNNAYLTDLNEKVQTKIPDVTSGIIQFEVKPHQVVTILIQ